MDAFQLISLLFCVAVAIGYLNYRFFNLQATIAIMIGSVLISSVLLIFEYLGISSETAVRNLFAKIPLDSLLLKGMLSFLLFAGAQTIDVSGFKRYKYEIGILSSLSTIGSCILLSIFVYYLLPFLGLNMNFFYCLVFGALISPTDPIAVLSTFKEINPPKKTDILVAGESLFNDGVGIILFLSAIQLALGGPGVTLGEVFLLFLREAVGGIAYGLLLGGIIFLLLRNLNAPKIAILVTLAVVSGGYSIAELLKISGPLAMVVAGMMMSFLSEHEKFPKAVRDNLENFWLIIDEILNFFLFLIIGFELLVLKLSSNYIWALFALIPLALLVRWITVSIPMWVFMMKRKFSPYVITIV